MNLLKKVIIPLCIAIITFVLLVVFRTVPTAQLWKGFSILYVPLETDSTLVFRTLEENDCKEVISIFNQKVPYVNSFLPIKNYEADSYLVRRNAYFFDKNQSVMVYYIPEKYNKNAKNAVSALVNDYKIDAGLDSKSSFPLVTPLICVFVSLIFFIFAKNKFVYFVSCVFPLIFSFAMPFYINAAAVCLYLYGTFVAQVLWNRKGAFSYILKKPFIVIIFALSIVGTFFAGVLSGIFFVLSILSSISLLFIYKFLVEFLDSRRRFNPVLIRPANLMNMVNKISVKRGIFSGIALFAISILYVTSVNVFSISNSQDLYFPVPTSYNSTNEIPNMNEYIEWTWNEATRPFKSLNVMYESSPQNGDEITIDRFIDNDDGIKMTQEVIFCFDDEFKNEVIKSIDDLDYPAIEKLMKEQNADFFVDYSSNASEKFNLSNLICMLVMILLLAIMQVYYLNKGKSKS